MKHLERNRILTSLNHGFRSDYSCETQLTVTLHDFMKHTMLDCKPMLPSWTSLKPSTQYHTKKLLSKMDSYGIRGSINN